MNTPLLDSPHVYKKGKIFKLKDLEKSTHNRRYSFAAEKPTLFNIVMLNNNINQITARIWLNLNRLIAYFGISKDKNDSAYKHRSPYNKVQTDLNFLGRGIPAGFDLEKFQFTLDELNSKIRPNFLTEERLFILEEKIEEIRTSIRQVVG